VRKWGTFLKIIHRPNLPYPLKELIFLGVENYKRSKVIKLKIIKTTLNKYIVLVYKLFLLV
jgi:hypothetical protein